MVSAVHQNQTSLRVERAIEIEAPVQIAFEALLEQLGPAASMPDGTSMPMVLEPRPGGRWYRDLGEGAGHFWATVQVIKPPTLIELNGPLFMSYPAISHVQYRLTDAGDGKTTLLFLHRAIGELDPEHCERVSSGWESQLNCIQKLAESRR